MYLVIYSYIAELAFTAGLNINITLIEASKTSFEFEHSVYSCIALFIITLLIILPFSAYHYLKFTNPEERRIMYKERYVRLTYGIEKQLEKYPNKL